MSSVISALAPIIKAIVGALVESLWTVKEKSREAVEADADPDLRKRFWDSERL